MFHKRKLKKKIKKSPIWHFLNTKRIYEFDQYVNSVYFGQFPLDKIKLKKPASVQLLNQLWYDYVGHLEVRERQPD